MGLGYAAATPAAVKWFGPHRRGLVAGLVVGGYGAAAIYIAPMAKSLIANYGISRSFVALGILFAIVIVAAAQLLAIPGDGYRPISSDKPTAPGRSIAQAQWSARSMLGTWQYYAMVLMFIASAQAGLLVIANAAPMAPVTVTGRSA